MVADLTRQKIVRAATDLYSTFGVLNISRREIAKSSGYAAGTVTAVAKNRSEFIRLVLAQMPYASVTKSRDVDRDASENPSCFPMRHARVQVLRLTRQVLVQGLTRQRFRTRQRNAR